MLSYSDIINKKKKEWNCSSLMERTEVGPKIPFSSPLLNYCTYGGVPRNQITEFYGTPGGGKSSTSIDICKNAKKIVEKEYEESVLALKEKIGKGDKSLSSELEELEDRGVKKVLYVDLEHTYDTAWAKKMGVNPDDIDVMQPPDVPAESILQTVEDLISTNELGLVVLDSIPSLVTEQELSKKYGERTVASVAGLLTVFLRKIVPKLTRYGCTLLIINQLRDNMDNPYVDNTPGGKALKFYSTLRISFRVGAPVDFLGTELPTSAENPAGYKIAAKIVKQKSAPWDRRNGSYYLMTQSGVRADMDYAQLAVNKYNIIRKAGAWFTVCDPESGEILCDETGKQIKLNGMARVYDYLQSNSEYFEKLKTFILADIESGGIDNELSE